MPHLEQRIQEALSEQETKWELLFRELHSKVDKSRTLYDFCVDLLGKGGGTPPPGAEFDRGFAVKSYRNPAGSAGTYRQGGDGVRFSDEVTADSIHSITPLKPVKQD